MFLMGDICQYVVRYKDSLQSRGRRRWRGDLGGDEDDGAGNAGERGWSD